MIVAAGGDDMVWPSVRFTEDIASRREVHGLTTTVLTEPGAGHRIVFPGEMPVTGGADMARGGNTSADANLGKRVWTELVGLLDMT